MNPRSHIMSILTPHLNFSPSDLNSGLGTGSGSAHATSQGGNIVIQPENIMAYLSENNIIDADWADYDISGPSTVTQPIPIPSVSNNIFTGDGESEEQNSISLSDLLAQQEVERKNFSPDEDENIYAKLFRLHNSMMLSMEDVHIDIDESLIPEKEREEQDQLQKTLSVQRKKIQTAFDKLGELKTKKENIERHHKKIKNWLQLIVQDAHDFSDMIDSKEISHALSKYIQDIHSNTDYQNVCIEYKKAEMYCEYLTQNTIPVSHMSKTPLCTLCAERIIDVSLQCGHTACNQCISKVSRCPVCRDEPIKPIHIYF